MFYLSIQIYPFIPSVSKTLFARPKTDNLRNITTTSSRSRIETRPIYVGDISRTDHIGLSVKNIAESVVKIASLRDNMIYQGTGTIIKATPDKIVVLTSRHVLRLVNNETNDAMAVALIKYTDSDSQPLITEVKPAKAFLHKESDLAIVEIDNRSYNITNAKPLKIADNSVKAKDVVHLLGYGVYKECRLSSGMVYKIPANEEHSFDKDYSNEFTLAERYDFLIRKTCNATVYCEPGDSGGPLLNNDGEVTGVISAATDQRVVKVIKLFGVFSLALNKPAFVPRGDCNFIDCTTIKRFIEDYRDGKNIEVLNL